MEESSKVIIRPCNSKRQGDLGLIYSSWRNALWFAESRPITGEGSDAFYKQTTTRIRETLKEPDIAIRMACMEHDHDMLIGYSVMCGENLEFVYVKIDYRGKGIGKLLTRGFKTVSRPETKIGKSICKALGLHIKENEDGREEAKEEQPRSTGILQADQQRSP